MKKIFLFLAVASTSMFVSCSDDEDTNNGPAVTSITLTSDVTEVVAGEPVTFTVTDNNAAVVTSNSTITANNTPITGGVFTTEEAGTYTVKATYTNSSNVVLESNTITVIVNAATVPNNYTFNGTVYSIDNMIFQVDGNSTDGISIFNVPTSGGETVPCSLWMGVAFNGELSGLATATHYYQYTLFVPAVVDGTGAVTGINLPGEATAIAGDVYAEEDLVPFDLDTVDGGTVTFANFTEVASAPTVTENASIFSAGSTTVISHFYDGVLKGNTPTSSGIFYGNLTGARGISKSIPSEKVNLTKIKIAKK